MGSGASKQETTTTTTTTTTKTKPYCPDCEKDQQKDLPQNDSISSEGQPCDAFYRIVDECMKANKGQVSFCTKEWADFQKCHAQSKKQDGGRQA